ncbi:hypothetical protein PABG_07729 [Paracoccidioides brasiliensis Pb03]|nr:hypothetical protein PABG_07729 [Paracoccidioides brasiliensis Pb03]
MSPIYICETFVVRDGYDMIKEGLRVGRINDDDDDNDDDNDGDGKRAKWPRRRELLGDWWQRALGGWTGAGRILIRGGGVRRHYEDLENVGL